MTQPPGDPNRPQYPPPDPGEQGQEFSYPPPVDPYPTSARPVFGGPPPAPPQPPFGGPPTEPHQPTFGGPPPGYGMPPASPLPPYGPPPASGPPASGAPYPGPPTSGSPYPGAAQPGQAYPPPYQPSAPPFQQQGYGQAAGYPGAPSGFDPATGYPLAPPPPKKKRGLMITLIALGVAVVLCGGGGIAAYFYLQNQDGTGAESATVAVSDFLAAVYTDGDVAKAEKLVCAAARNRKELTQKIDAIKTEKAKYKGPSYTWPEPAVSEEKADSAKVSVKVKLTTDDEKVAEQQLTFTVVKRTGWFVCEVQTS